MPTNNPVPGTVVPVGSAFSPSGSQGLAGPIGPTGVSLNAGNQATLGTDSLIYVPDPTPVITSVRLRSFNALGAGNPTFEVDQRMVHSSQSNPANGAFICDRWLVSKSGVTATVAAQSQQMGVFAPTPPLIPGTNFLISQSVILLNVTGAQGSLAAGDNYGIMQFVEGQSMRELYNDAHSISLLVWSTVAPRTLSVALRDVGGTRSLVVPFTINTAGTWQLVTLPNLAVWGAGGGWTTNPGATGYLFNITLAAGSTSTAPASGTWQNGNYVGAPTMSNGLASTGQYYFAFVQHEPGSQCTQLIDCPFNQNYDACLRYYCKANPYGALAGATGNNAYGVWTYPLAVTSATLTLFGYVPFPKRMAKSPTCTVWNNTTGAVNAASLTSPGYTGNVAIASVISSPGDGAIVAIQAPASTTTGPSLATANWAADTGW